MKENNKGKRKKATYVYIYFLGLRPLAGYAFFEVIPCHVMFLHEKRSVCYDIAG